MTEEMLDATMQAFILEVIAKHRQPAHMLCKEDPFILKASVYLSCLLPNTKFLLMVWDSSASLHSIITHKIAITGFDLSSHLDCLTKWNKAIKM